MKSRQVVLDSMELWHRFACPHPDQRAFDVQLGVHLEEIAELLAEFRMDDKHDLQRAVVWGQLRDLSDALKKGTASASIVARKDFCDALVDGIVTSIGTGYRAGMQIPEACVRVDESNWSKYVDEKPLFDQNGKITKGPNYKAPDLKDCY